MHETCVLYFPTWWVCIRLFCALSLLLWSHSLARLLVCRLDAEPGLAPSFLDRLGALPFAAVHSTSKHSVMFGLHFCFFLHTYSREEGKKRTHEKPYGTGNPFTIDNHAPPNGFSASGELTHIRWKCIPNPFSLFVVCSRLVHVERVPTHVNIDRRLLYETRQRSRTTGKGSKVKYPLPPRRSLLSFYEYSLPSFGTIVGPLRVVSLRICFVLAALRHSPAAGMLAEALVLGDNPQRVSSSAKDFLKC